MMGDIYKEINTKDGQIICKRAKGIKVGTYIDYSIFDENGNVEKTLSFSMDNDFSFSAMIYPKEGIRKINIIKKVEFTIDKQNPLYEPIKKFLGEDKEFLLDDDKTQEINMKTMKMLDEEENIRIIFENQKWDEEIFYEKFKIFIKDILINSRSKLNKQPGNNTKERLLNLFAGLEATLIPKEALEDYIVPENNICINNLYYCKRSIFKIIPELKATDGFDQKNPYHIYDVWKHTTKAMQKSKKDLDIRLALLLHDIGKPYSYQEENGVRHFKGHPQKSAEMAKEILTRLGYDEKRISDVCFLIENHAKTIDVGDVNEDNLEITKKLLHVQYCDAYAYNPEYIRPVLDKLDVIYRKLESKEKQERGER